MIQKPVARSVIAAVVVAGILTLCLVTTKPLTNTAFAKTLCKLALDTTKPYKASPVIIRAYLVCPDYRNRVSGATVDIIAEGGALKNSVSKSMTTDSHGFAETTFDLGPSSSRYTIKGNYAGDSQYEPATKENAFFIVEMGALCRNYPCVIAGVPYT